MAKFYALIVTVAFFDLLAIFAAKMAVVSGKSLYIILTVLGFGIAGYFFALSLRFQNVAIVNVLWTALSIVLVAVMGHFYFKEHLSFLQIAGMMVTMVGIVLLSIE